MERGRLAWAALVMLGAAACSGLTALDDAGPALSPAEADIVRGQADKAMAERSFKAAWAQEIAAGADRTRLERVALAALLDQSGHAGDMFTALREKWGDLSPDARERVAWLVADAQRRGAWERALELEVLTADDPPAFKRAWAVYEAAPANRAPSLLESIGDAREAHTQSAESGD